MADISNIKEVNLQKYALDAANDGFIVYGGERNGSIVMIHQNYTDKKEQKSDFRDLGVVAGMLAQEELSVVQIMPRLHYKDPAYSKLYGSLIGTDKERKCPDFKITYKRGGSVFTEYESYVRPAKDRKIGNMLKDGLTQSSRIVIDVRDGISIDKVARGIKGRLGSYNIDKVTIFDGKKISHLYTKESGFALPYNRYNTK